MSGQWRKQLDWLHGWVGLLTGWALYFVFLTGTLGYLDSEIDRWMQPELPPIYHRPVVEQLKMAEAYLQKHAGRAEQWRIFTSIDRNQPWLKVQWREAGQANYQSLLLSQDKGLPLHARETAGGKGLYRLHYAFHYIPKSVARWLVSFLAMTLLLILCSGLLIHRHLLRDWFTFRPGKGLRTGLDLHLLGGVSILPFLFMISYSGLLFYLPMQLPQFAVTEVGPKASSLQQVLAKPQPKFKLEQNHELKPTELTLVDIVRAVELELATEQIRRVGQYLQQGEITSLVIFPRTQLFQRQEKPLGVSVETSGLKYESYSSHRPARAIYESVLGLHEGTFAGSGLRAGYVLSGGLGCLAILTGLLIWQKKRMRRLSGALGYRLVGGLNLGVILGLPCAIAIYFIGNRILPLDLPQRADTELDLLFISWALVIILALVNSSRAAWVVLTAFTAVCYLVLPWLSLIYTETNLYQSFLAKDWAYMGFEVVVITLGSLLLWISVYLQWLGKS